MEDMERGGLQTPPPRCPLAERDLGPVLGRQPALGPYLKPALLCPSRERPTAACRNRTVCAGLVRPIPRVLLQAALGPGQEPGQEGACAEQVEGFEWPEQGCQGCADIPVLQLGPEGPWRVGAQGLGRGQGGGALPQVREGDTTVPTSCSTLDPSIHLSKPQLPHP